MGDEKKEKKSKKQRRGRDSSYAEQEFAVDHSMDENQSENNDMTVFSKVKFDTNVYE
jgi:hypothetical protein